MSFEAYFSSYKQLSFTLEIRIIVRNKRRLQIWSVYIAPGYSVRCVITSVYYIIIYVLRVYSFAIASTIRKLSADTQKLCYRTRVCEHFL